MTLQEMTDYILFLALNCAADSDLIRQSLVVKGVSYTLIEKAFQAARLALG